MWVSLSFVAIEDAQSSYCPCLVFAETVGNVATLIAQSCGGLRAVGHVSELLAVADSKVKHFAYSQAVKQHSNLLPTKMIVTLTRPA
jgi:hypothetical protein